MSSLRPGYHIFVDSQGDILLFQTVCLDGSLLDPWRPVTYTTLPSAIRGTLTGPFTLFLSDDLPTFIHTPTQE